MEKNTTFGGAASDSPQSVALINENYLKLSEDYFFTEIEKRLNAFKVIHPKTDIIDLGRGDVTLPIATEAVKAMQEAVKEMGTAAGVHGYGPGCGYRFLIDKIIKHDYAKYGVSIAAGEVFVSEGAKTDAATIAHILGRDNIIAITDPVYPVYENATIMSGRAGAHGEGFGKWSNIVYLDCLPENDFKPLLPQEKVDVIYLCYPNNPTGVALTKTELKGWVDYALENHALIIYDGAYEAFITEKDIPHSIYEIKGAKKVAIEVRSYSKTAGFTGLRCGYTVVPTELLGYTLMGEKVELNRLWRRRQTTCHNGVSYVVQRGAEATYSRKGKAETHEVIASYLEQAGIIKSALLDLGQRCWGGVSSPYVWMKTPNGEPSWKFFQQMLYEIGITVAPGVGFGDRGEGYVRFSGFSTADRTREAVERLKKWF